MRSICTIITSDHLPFARALSDSILSQETTVEFSILVIDANLKNTVIPKHRERFYFIEDLLADPLCGQIFKKYAHTNKDHFRWAFKPLFISYLLKTRFSKVIYVDPDVFFVASPEFLFNDLDEAGMLLTPHWRDINPLVNEENFITLFKDGQFNAGFIGASKKGISALTWWAEVCHYKMERNLIQGLFDDQRYLDALQVAFSDVKIIRHQGCNLAFWNLHTCKRELIDGKIKINKVFAPIFIHFTKDTVINIVNKNDDLLSSYLTQYRAALQTQGIDLFLWWNDIKSTQYQNTYYKIKHKMRIRTRIKQFFFKLAEKL